jgi:hypothetical protein
MSFERKYKKSLSEQWCMRFETLHPENDNYGGVITHIKPDFIVLREEEYFEFDGIVILPKRFIKNVRDGKYDKCCNEILRHNGAIKKFKAPNWIDACETIPQILSLMQKRDIWGAVEIIINDETDTDFYLGKFTQVNEKEFSIKSYDATGKWEKDFKLDFDGIFRIEFDSKYCNYFNSFMKSKTKTVP